MHTLTKKFLVTMILSTLCIKKTSIVVKSQILNMIIYEYVIIQRCEPKQVLQLTPSAHNSIRSPNRSCYLHFEPSVVVEIRVSINCANPQSPEQNLRQGFPNPAPLTSIGKTLLKFDASSSNRCGKNDAAPSAFIICNKVLQRTV